ncbi:fluoride efflux transporter CrcB [Caldicellulosiruptoraceae bacterium PP1]
MHYLLVGLGGIVGSITRFALGKFISEKNSSDFPIATLLINISGAFLLGLVNGIGVKDKLYLLLADGFLGAYTTFSTFMYEGIFLLEEDEKMPAFRYILGTIFFGIIGFVVGYILGKFIR